MARKELSLLKYGELVFTQIAMDRREFGGVEPRHIWILNDLKNN
jgi:hypothetical protein